VIAWALLNTDTTKSSTDMGCRRGCRRASAPRTQAAGGGGNLSTLTLPRVATSEKTPAGREIGEGEPHEDGEPEEARAGKGDDQGPPLAGVLSRFVLELGDAISGISRVPSQAARSIG
jgi:hypothetical protein